MYTDDVAKSERNAELKEMLKGSKNFGKKEKVKPKYEQIKDNDVRERKGENEEEIEMGRRKNRDKKIKYLEYVLQKNGEAEKHKGKARESVSRAMIAMKRIWSTERIFKENYMKRMKMFDSLIGSVALYEADIYIYIYIYIYIWQNENRLNKKKKIYKMDLKFGRTSNYVLLEKTKMKDIRL